MGLGGMKYAWQRHTKDFAHAQPDAYSVLAMDNRGIGESDKPFFRYSTSEMARDVVEVLDHIGWSAKRECHVVGISMGGMIAQELVSPAAFPSVFDPLPRVRHVLQYRGQSSFQNAFVIRRMLQLPAKQGER